MNKEEFITELQKLDIIPTNQQLELLEQYYQILIEENKKYNLTRITIEEDVYLKHFYDSLTLTKAISLTNQELCDIGTGAGFPGIVLKIFYPNLKITLIESSTKKCNFLQLVIKLLNLSNIKVLNTRVELLSSNYREKYDIIVSRAVAKTKILLEISIPLLKVNGTFIAMKANINSELDKIDSYLKELNIIKIPCISFELPKEKSIRNLIIFTKKFSTSDKYPRKYQEILKKEL